MRQQDDRVGSRPPGQGRISGSRAQHEPRGVGGAHELRLLDAVVGGRIPGGPGQRAWAIAIPIPPRLVFRSTFPNSDPHRHIPVMASQSITAPSGFQSACGDRRASIHLHLIPIALACPRGDGRSSGPSRESQVGRRYAGHGLHRGRQVPYGFRPALSRGSAAAFRRGRFLLHRSHACHQSPIRRIRCGDRLCHGGRAAAESRRLSRCGAGDAGAGRAGLSQDDGPCESARHPQLVALGPGGELAPARRSRKLAREPPDASRGAGRL